MDTDDLNGDVVVQNFDNGSRSPAISPEDAQILNTDAGSVDVGIQNENPEVQTIDTDAPIIHQDVRSVTTNSEHLYRSSSTTKPMNPLGNSFYSQFGISPAKFYSYQPRIWQKQIETADDSSRFSTTVKEDTETKVDNVLVADEIETEEPVVFEEWNQGPVVTAMFVRLLLIGHNVMTVWRVVGAYDDNLYWLLILSNVLLLIEGNITIVKKAGIEPSWWCPCFLIYLSSVIPSIWLLQISQHYDYIDSITSTEVPMATVTNVAGVPTITALTTTLPSAPISPVDNDVWVIIVEESMVYLLVFCRWMLPRDKAVSRDFIADLLLEFLAIASDIMELLAVFDEDSIRGNLRLTYAIMAVWSISFIQFVPILMQKRRFRQVRTVNVEWITDACGDKFVEVVVTCMSIFLQDGPFLALRLYIMISESLVTYSLVFFVLKNIVTLMLLFYRLFITCYRLPCTVNKPTADEMYKIVSANDVEKKSTSASLPIDSRAADDFVYDKTMFDKAVNGTDVYDATTYDPYDLSEEGIYSGMYDHFDSNRMGRDRPDYDQIPKNSDVYYVEYQPN